MLDPNNNGAVSLDELIYKASEEICKKIKATPEQTARHSEAVANFFGGAGLKRGEETEWDAYIKGWKGWQEKNYTNGNITKSHLFVCGEMLFST